MLFPTVQTATIIKPEILNSILKFLKYSKALILWQPNNYTLGQPDVPCVTLPLKRNNNPKMELLVLSPTKTSYLKELQFQPLPGVEFKPVSQESPGQ